MSDEGRIVDGLIELSHGRDPERRRLDIPPGQAPILRLAPGSRIIVDNIELVFHDQGPFIVVTVERWQKMVDKAIRAAQAEVDTNVSEVVAEKVTRQVRRSLARDTRN